MNRAFDENGPRSRNDTMLSASIRRRCASARYPKISKRILVWLDARTPYSMAEGGRTRLYSKGGDIVVQKALA